jgi:broad specificity phosphatase PhoE
MADRIRGTSNIPLSALGRKQVADLALALKGQVNKIHSSDLDRAVATAAAIRQTNPDAFVVNITHKLHPWRMGEHEGKLTEEMLPIMLDRIAKNPDQVMEGISPQSGSRGESFNQYKNRLLGYIRDEVLRNANPKEVTVVTTHYRPIRTLESWLKAGSPHDLSIDTNEMLQKGDSEPSDLFYLHPDGKLVKVNDAKDAGVYFARHGATEWNG